MRTSGEYLPHASRHHSSADLTVAAQCVGGKTLLIGEIVSHGPGRPLSRNLGSARGARRSCASSQPLQIVASALQLRASAGGVRRLGTAIKADLARSRAFDTSVTKTRLTGAVAVTWYRRLSFIFRQVSHADLLTPTHVATLTTTG